VRTGKKGKGAGRHDRARAKKPEGKRKWGALSKKVSRVGEMSKDSKRRHFPKETNSLQSDKPPPGGSQNAVGPASKRRWKKKGLPGRAGLPT